MINKLFKSRLFFLCLGLIIAGSIGVYAYTISSSDVSYNNSSRWLEANNVKDALDNLYEKSNAGIFGEDIIVANWLNEKYTVSTTWETMQPTVYSNSFFENNSGNLKFKKAGKYRIYYQSAFDGGTDGQGYIRVLINGTQVATCGNYHARCDNRLIYYDANINVDDVVAIQGYTTNARWGARVVVSIVSLKDE